MDVDSLPWEEDCSGDESCGGGELMSGLETVVEARGGAVFAFSSSSSCFCFAPITRIASVSMGSTSV